MRRLTLLLCLICYSVATVSAQVRGSDIRLAIHRSRVYLLRVRQALKKRNVPMYWKYKDVVQAGNKQAIEAYQEVDPHNWWGNNETLKAVEEYNYVMREQKYRNTRNTARGMSYGTMKDIKTKGTAMITALQAVSFDTSDFSSAFETLFNDEVATALMQADCDTTLHMLNAAAGTAYRFFIDEKDIRRSTARKNYDRSMKKFKLIASKFKDIYNKELCYNLDDDEDLGSVIVSTRNAVKLVPSEARQMYGEDEENVNYAMNEIVRAVDALAARMKEDLDVWITAAEVDCQTMMYQTRFTTKGTYTCTDSEMYCTKPTISGGAVTSQSSHVYTGNSVTYQCNDDYVMLVDGSVHPEGTFSKVCKGSNNWDKTNVVSCAAPCDAPTTPQNGALTANEVIRYGDAVSFTCTANYAMMVDGSEMKQSTYTATCRGRNEWSSGVDVTCLAPCDKPTAPADSSLQANNPVKYKETAVYICDANYVMFLDGSASSETSHTKTCNGGNIWSSGSVVSCKAPCDKPASPSGGNINANNPVKYGETAVYSCNANYVMLLNGEASTAASYTKKCEGDNVWSQEIQQGSNSIEEDSQGNGDSTAVTCMAPCDKPTATEGMSVDANDPVKFGGSATLSCNSRYHLSVDHVASSTVTSYSKTCKGNGVWSDDDLDHFVVCNATCSVPSIANADFTYFSAAPMDGKIFKSNKITITCQDKYVLTQDYKAKSTITTECKGVETWGVNPSTIACIPSRTPDGCVEDDTNNRVLTGKYTPSSSMSVHLCMALCADYTYAGVQGAGGRECFCGNSLRERKELSESKCDIKCPDSSAKYEDCSPWGCKKCKGGGQCCGGSSKLSLFKRD